MLVQCPGPREVERNKPKCGVLGIVRKHQVASIDRVNAIKQAEGQLCNDAKHCSSPPDCCHQFRVGRVTDSDLQGRAASSAWPHQMPHLFKAAMTSKLITSK